MNRYQKLKFEKEVCEEAISYYSSSITYLIGVIGFALMILPIAIKYIFSLPKYFNLVFFVGIFILIVFGLKMFKELKKTMPYSRRAKKIEKKLNDIESEGGNKDGMGM